VSPSLGYNGEETALAIYGRNFYPAVHVNTLESSDASFDAQFQAELVSELTGEVVALSAVTLEDYSSLTASVPDGAEPGWYDLVVTAPSGVSSALPHAFEVTDTKATALLFDTSSEVLYGVIGDMITLNFYLADDDGEEVAEPVEVVFQATGEDIGGLDYADDGGLSGFERLSDGSGVRGALSVDGKGWVTFSTDDAASFSLTLEPADEESQLDGDQRYLIYEPRELNAIEVDIDLDDPVTTIAGDSFGVYLTLVDEEGNPLSQLADILLTETCGGTVLAQNIEFVGSTRVEVAVSVATGDDCPANQIKAWDNNTDSTGLSETFETAPGPLTGLNVVPRAESVVAGEEGFEFRVTPVDEWGNVILDYSQALTFYDEIDGDRQPIGESDCGAIWLSGERDCEVVLTRAGEAVVVSVEDTTDASVTGEAVPIEVRVADPDHLTLELGASEPYAGQSYQLTVAAFDRFENVLTLASKGEEILVFDPLGGTACEKIVVNSDGGYRLVCSSTAAGERSLSVEVPFTDATLSEVVALSVINADLAELVLTPAADTATAGEPFDLLVEGFDEFGNPYISQRTGGGVTLSDSSGSLDTSSVTLDAGGVAEPRVTLYTALDPVTITASHRGTALGAAELTVEAGPLAEVAVTPAATWTWVEEPLAVEIRGLDSWGNVVTDYAGPVELSSPADQFAALTLAAFEGGVAETQLTFSDPALQAVIEALGPGGEAGTSAGVDVLNPDCDDAPVASLELGGGAEAVSCLDGDEVSITAALNAFGEAAAAYHLSVDGADHRRISGPDGEESVTLTADGAGVQVVELAVTDVAACGDVVEALWWVAPNDGTPAGPLTVSAADSEVLLGAGNATDISVQAFDCTGDRASFGGTLRARTDLGSLDASTDGGGHYLLLDGSGQASTQLLAGETFGGDATVEVGLASGAAWGAVTVNLSGDNARPAVLQADPSGATDEEVSRLWLRFSEAISLDAADGDTVALTDGDGAAVALEGYSLDEGDTILEIELAAPLDGGADGYTLTLNGTNLPGAVIDTAGNRMAGEWGTRGSDYTLRFGAVSDAGLTMEGCAAAEDRFFPDGDDSAGEEADAMELQVYASAAPEWWLVEVYSASSELIYAWRYSPAGAKDTLSWDGRDSAGFVAPEGSYTVAVSAVDADDNLSAACEVPLALEQHFRGP
jgi:hypothetical protein